MKDRTAPRISVQGPFTGKDLGAGRWCLIGAAAPGATGGSADPREVYLKVADPRAAEVLTATDITRVDLDWHASRVSVAVSGPRGTRRVEADSAIVHQPRSGLYRALPLAGFDIKARRFWSRVFALMRIPGGRWLLRILARRRR